MAYTNEKETLKRVKAKENERKQQILRTWASSDEGDFKFISVSTVVPMCRRSVKAWTYFKRFARDFHASVPL